MSTTEQTQEAFDPELAEEFHELSYYATDDYVEIEVVSVESNSPGDTIDVTFDPPLGEEFTRSFDMPHDPTNRSNEFMRLLAYCGHNLSNAEKMIGERIPFNYAEGEWELSIPRTRREAVRDWYGGDGIRATFERTQILGASVVMPITWILVTVLAARDDDDKAMAPFILFGLLTAIWAVVVLGLTMAALALL